MSSRGTILSSSPGMDSEQPVASSSIKDNRRRLNNLWANKGTSSSAGRRSVSLPRPSLARDRREPVRDGRKESIQERQRLERMLAAALDQTSKSPGVAKAKGVVKEGTKEVTKGLHQDEDNTKDGIGDFKGVETTSMARTTSSSTRMRTTPRFQLHQDENTTKTKATGGIETDTRTSGDHGHGQDNFQLHQDEDNTEDQHNSQIHQEEDITKDRIGDQMGKNETATRTSGDHELHQDENTTKTKATGGVEGGDGGGQMGAGETR